MNSVTDVRNICGSAGSASAIPRSGFTRMTWKPRPSKLAALAVFRAVVPHLRGCAHLDWAALEAALGALDDHFLVRFQVGRDAAYSTTCPFGGRDVVGSQFASFVGGGCARAFSRRTK